jgi:8-oxo-dGTP diphosphatase
MGIEELRYCPRCAGTLAVRDVGHPASPHPACESCGFVLWQNVKPSVEAVIVRGDGPATQVVLGRRMIDGEERWDMPGGFLNAGDRLHGALRRECLREMDVEVAVGDLLGVYEDTFYGERIVSIVYVCTILSGEPRGADIIDGVRWFGVGESPTAASPAVAEALAALRLRYSA